MQAISREVLPLPATPKGVTTYGQRYGLLFMLKGPRVKTVSRPTLGFPEYGMANASNFTRGFTPASNHERGNNIGAMKWAFIYVKRAKAKTVSYRTLGFPEYGMVNASNFTRGFTPARNPEMGNNILWATKLAFIYVKRARAKNSVISYLKPAFHGACFRRAAFSRATFCSAS